MNKKTPPTQETKKFINSHPEVQLQISWRALDDAIRCLQEDHEVSMKQNRLLGPLIQVATSSHMISMFTTKASKRLVVCKDTGQMTNLVLQ